VADLFARVHGTPRKTDIPQLTREAREGGPHSAGYVFPNTDGFTGEILRTMYIAGRLRAFRLQKKLTQGEIEKRTGLQRSYISRVENGYTIPSVATLEKWARALAVPLYQIFFDEETPTAMRFSARQQLADKAASIRPGEDKGYLARLRWLLGRMGESDRQVLLDLARAMTKKKRRVRGRRGR
jgi:transcriptional regulator with XRE-family HTH domain